MSKETSATNSNQASAFGAPKFDVTAIQDAIHPYQDNMKGWGDLAQAQAHAALATINEAVECLKGVKKLADAFEIMKDSAENALSMTTRNLKDATSLGVMQFRSAVDRLEKTRHIPEAFSDVAKGMKDAATNMERALEFALNERAVTSKSPIWKSNAAANN